MRVLVLIKGLGMGGAEQLIVESARVWDRHSFEHRVAYVLPWKDQLVPALRAEGIGVECIGGTRGGMGPRTWLRLRRLVAEFDPAVVHAHLPSTGILARLVGGRPVVYTEHNVASSYRFPTATLNRLTYGRNAAVGAVSQAVAESLTGFPGAAATVIPNGVAVDADPAAVAAVRTELGIPAERPLVVHVGNIRPHKGHATLVAATRELIGRIPDVLVVSVGGEKNPGDLARMESLAAEAGVTDHIRFLGRRDDARSFIAAADLFVNPADVEGLPLVVLEALALGRPVVATAVGGVPSVVIDGETGRLVPPGQPSALAATVADLLSDPGAPEMAAAGAARVRRQFGAEAMVRAYEDIYRRVGHG
jgi:glycosyltransferase involved in cell wall biosynthesis